jgi:hypothetical protein
MWRTAPAAPVVVSYTSHDNHTYTLNTTMVTQAQAQRSCNARGGHLAVWPSQQTQNEVEAFFAGNGYLLPTFHKAYWMGMVKRDGEFGFLDATIKTSYRNWGMYATGEPGEGYPEPNNYFGDENCAIGNFSMIRQVPPVWGFADYQCTDRFVFICKNQATGVFNYTDPSTGYNYLLNTNNMTFDQGERYCQMQGGHLVAYSTREEQAAVESFYTANGMLLPGFHTLYWMGLYVEPENWPYFKWKE